VLRRCAVAVCLVVGLTFVTFVLYDLMPIDPACVVASCDQKPMSPSERQLIHHAIGVDQPFTTQYLHWAGRAIHGDLGIAWQGLTIDPGSGVYGTSVASEIVPATWVSLSVVGGGLLLLLTMVIPIALLSASRPGSWFDRLTASFLLLGVSTHPLVIGLILQTVSQRWPAIPWGGYCPIHEPHVSSGGGVGFTPCYGLGNWAWHLVLPCLTFAFFFAALYVRVLRTTLLDVLNQPYISTARAKGASELRVMFRHALRNAIRPILTMTGMEAGMAVSALLYIEVVFQINGLGRLSLTAFSGDAGYDRPVIAALVLVIGIGIFGLNLVVDLLYPLIDRRLGPGQVQRSAIASTVA
jgi:peptide/nickel transport system permease protein